jgi:LPS-assembly protein
MREGELQLCHDYHVQRQLERRLQSDAEKWKIGLNGYYDVKNGNMQSLTASISRDLHCWQMSINVTPVGYTHFFSITINPKAGILQDLKINRTKYFYNE